MGVRTKCCGSVLLASAAVIGTIYFSIRVLRCCRKPKTKTPPRNLLRLSAAERRAFLNSFDAIATDCDGTLWDMYRGQIPNVGAAITALQALGKRIVYVTNNATRTDAEFEQSFRAMGIEATMADVLHPGTVCVDMLRERQFEGLIYVIGSPNLRECLEKAGHQLVPAEPRQQMNSVSSVVNYVQDGLPVSLVIFDWDHNLEFKQLQRAFVYLRENADCELWLGVTDAWLPVAGTVPASEGLVDLMQKWSGRKGYECGKPGVAVKEVALRKCRVTDTKRVLFIGDA